MCDKSCDPISQSNDRLASIRRLPPFLDSRTEVDNSDLDDKPYGLNVDDVRGPDNGSIYASTQKLSDSPVNNLVRQSYLHGIKKEIHRVASLGNRTQLPTAEIPDLSKTLDRADPESLVAKTKPFYRRTCFSCLIYTILLSMLVAAILVLAVDRAVIIPREVLGGEMLPDDTTRKSDSSEVASSMKLVAPNNDIDTSSVPKADEGLPLLVLSPATVSPDLSSVKDTTTTVKPEEGRLSNTSVTRPVGLSTESTPSQQEDFRENWLLVLSLSGPLQRSNL